MERSPQDSRYYGVAFPLVIGLVVGGKSQAVVVASYLGQKIPRRLCSAVIQGELHPCGISLLYCSGFLLAAALAIPSGILVASWIRTVGATTLSSCVRYLQSDSGTDMVLA